MDFAITPTVREAYLAIFGNLPEADRAAVLEGRYDETTSMQALAKFRHEAVAPLSADIIRLRGFIQSIERDWMKSIPADNGDYSDGYEDCLREYSLKARKVLEGASLEEVSA